MRQYVKWSPQGRLVMFHNKGIALWGDSDFNKQGRFAHNGVGDSTLVRGELHDHGQ